MITLNRWTLACLFVMAALLTGCSHPNEPPHLLPSPPASPYDTSATTLWTNESSPIGTPMVGATEFVSYVRTATGMAMAAYDLATGTELWRHEADPGPSNTSQMRAPLVERDGHSWTAYLAPHDGEIVALTVVDARSGVPVSLSTDLLWVTSLPRVCTAAPTQFCFTGDRTKSDAGWKLTGQADPVTGAVSIGGPPEVPVDNGRLQGEHIYTRWGQEKEPDEIGYVEGGVVRWRRPYSEVFGPTSSSTYGSWWVDAAEQPVIVGSWFDLDAPYKEAKVKGTSVLDLTTNGMLVGLDPMTGAVVWSLPGAARCENLGQVPNPPSATVVPACRFSKGTMTVGSDGRPTFSADLSYDLIGVELTTGKVVWTVPLHRDVYLLLSSPTPWVWSASSETTLVVLSRARQWVLVDRASGTVTVPESTTVMGCLTSREGFKLPGRTAYYFAGAANFACHTDGTMSAIWSVGAARDAGASGGDASLIVISSAKGFVAVRVTGA